MTIVVTGANLLILFAIAWMVWKKETVFRNVYWPALLLKCAAGIAMGWVYMYYYPTGDTYAYYEDAEKIAKLFHDDAPSYFRFLVSGDESFTFWSTLIFSEPRSLLLSKVTSFFCLLTKNNYTLISLYFSLISFLGTWFLVKVLVRLQPTLQYGILFSFLFFPSIVFWTSGLMKETLAMAALYFITAIFMKVWTKQKTNILQWLLLILAFYLLWNLKYYYMAVLLPVMVTALIFHFGISPLIKFRYVSVALLVWLAVFIIPLYIASRVHPNFYPERFLGVIVSNYNEFLEKPAHDMVYYDHLEATPLSFLMNTPKALVTGLFRPFPWESNSISQALASFENVVLMLLFIMSIPQWKNALRSRHRLLIFSALVYGVLLCIFLALSTPNFGTLARYRVGFLPFFVLLISSFNPFLLRFCAFIERTFSSVVRNRS